MVSESSGTGPSGEPMLSPSAARAATPSVSRFRRGRRMLLAVGVDGVIASKPSALSFASMSRAMSTVSSPDFAASRASVLSVSGTEGARGAVLFRVRRALRPTLSPLRSFSSRLSSAALSSSTCGVATAVLALLAFASSAACRRFSTAVRSSANALFSARHFFVRTTGQHVDVQARSERSKPCMR